MITREDIQELMTAAVKPAVSIYIPTHMAGREIAQDGIRLDNALRLAARRLMDLGLGQQETNAIIEPATKLVSDHQFWRHQKHGLAVFLGPDFLRVHKLAVQVPELEMVARRFHITPLLPLLAGDERFVVLTVSSARARVFEGGRYALTEVDLGDRLPQGVGDVLAQTDYEDDLQRGGSSRPRAGSSQKMGPATNNTMGGGREQMVKDQTKEYLLRVANGFSAWLGSDRVPVVLVGLEDQRGHILPMLRAKLPGEVLEIETNPDGLEPSDLHKRCYALLSPRRQDHRRDAKEHLDSLVGLNDQRAALHPEDVVRAARWGRVDTLVLADGQHLWGRYEEDKDRVVAHGQPRPDDEDLLDYAAQCTLLSGGQVEILDKQDLPIGRVMAAILRY